MLRRDVNYCVCLMCVISPMTKTMQIVQYTTNPNHVVNCVSGFVNNTPATPLQYHEDCHADGDAETGRMNVFLLRTRARAAKQHIPSL